ncbi:hypothetical protein [Muricoccus aerilatus]|uniref:hypothetical protein n=1 Tax=Muricoccus aerilatus TaxID=452982 RepID=UPI0005C13A95|nr:hypothetical protein [Roseomonas aerilata]
MRSAERLFAASLPLGFGLLAVLLGKDNNWDLLHYHYYNPYSWLHGRFGQDVLAADYHVFFNPLLDVPFYLGNQVLPAAVLTFLLGAVHGVNGVLLWRIARHALPGAELLPGVVMLIGMLGAGSLYVMGTTYYDTLASLPIYVAVWLIARAGLVAFEGPLRRSLPVLLAAGIAAGAGMGLKQTGIVLAGGVGMAVVLLPGRRIAHGAAYGVGILLGLTLTSGFWLWHLWQATGNPLFPYFNHVFHSPLGSVSDDRARNAMPRDLLEALAYPFVFTRMPWRIDSPVLRDPKLMVAYLVVPFSILFALFGRQRIRDMRAEKRFSLFLLVAAAVTYALWLHLFSIYRYIVPLEIMVPLLLVVAAGFLPLPARAKRWAVVGLLLLVVPVQPSNRDRLPWNGTQFDRFVKAVPPAGMDLSGAMIVVPGYHPGWRPNAFVIPFFPPEVSFLRILAFDNPAERMAMGFEAMATERIAAHVGPFFVLETPGGEEHVAASLARHGLTAEFSGCRPVAANAGSPLALCPARRENAD